jgi:hypothetical protein
MVGLFRYFKVACPQLLFFVGKEFCAVSNKVFE